MGTDNKGTAAPDFALVEGVSPLKGTSLPPDTVEVMKNPIDGTVNHSPLSYLGLFGDPDLLYLSANRVAGVSWANTGTLAGNNLTYVNQPIQANHINFPGTTSNYLSIPDEAALDFAGNTTMEIVCRIAADWQSEARRQVIVAKRGGGGQSYELAILGDSTGSLSGRLMFRISGATADTTSVCAHPIPLISDETAWIKVTWDGLKVTYYVAPDEATEPSSWMVLGDTTFGQNLTGTIAANTELVYIGGVPAVGATSMLDGRLYYLALRGVSGGPNVLEINVPVDGAAMTPDVTTTFVATSGQTVTITKSGTPPNTCRYHNTLDVTLTFPWYEVTLPSELVLGEEGILLMWAEIDSNSVMTQKTQIPIVSVMGVNPGEFPGFATWWSTQTAKIGSYQYGENTVVGGTATSVWSLAIPTTSNTGVFHWIERRPSTLNNRVGSICHAHNGSTAYDGTGTFYGVIKPGEAMSSTHKIRVNAWTGTPMNIVEVGFKMVTDKPPSGWGFTSESAWYTDVSDHGKALFDVTPTRNLGDGMYVEATGFPTWLGGIQVREGQWLVSTSSDGTTEPTVVWDVVDTSNNVWSNPRNMPVTLSDDLIITTAENFFVWAILSMPIDMYRDVVEGYDSASGCYINIGIDNDSSFGPYLYVELDQPTNYQWGEVYEDPDWELDGLFSTPIMAALYLERKSVGDDLLWMYVTGIEGWRQCLGETTGYPSEEISFASATTDGWFTEQMGTAIWAYGMDRPAAGSTKPSLATLDKMMSDVVQLTSR